MLANILRTITLYLLIVSGLRFMGKRQIGEMQPSELVITIMLSELAAVPIEDMRLPLVRGIVPVIILITLEVLFSFLTLKSRKAQNLIEGQSKIVVRHGEVLEAELKTLRYNIDDLMEDLRLCGYYDIRDVEYAMLETTGKLSVMPKPCSSYVTADDLGIKKAPAQLQYIVVRDGKVDESLLNSINMAKKEFLYLLKTNGVHDYKKLLFASVTETKKVFFQYLDKYR